MSTDYLVPNNLDEAIRILNETTPADVKKEFAEMDEQRAIGRVHFFGGMKMRNEWGFWQENKFTKWFNSLGIYHADDMSGIVFASFHRSLNGKDIDLDGQVKFYIKYWTDLGCPNGDPRMPNE